MSLKPKAKTRFTLRKEEIEKQEKLDKGIITERAYLQFEEEKYVRFEDAQAEIDEKGQNYARLVASLNEKRIEEKKKIQKLTNGDRLCASCHFSIAGYCNTDCEALKILKELLKE